MNVKQMQANFRAWVNKNAALASTVSILLVIATGAVIVFQLRDGPEQHQVSTLYYYDLDTGKLFPGPADAMPPIAVPGAVGARPMGALAYVYACRNCNDPVDQYVGYLEIYGLASAPQTAAQTAPADTPGETGGRRERLIGNAAPNGQSRFVSAVTDDAQKIIEEAERRCGEGNVPVRCLPPQPQ